MIEEFINKSTIKKIQNSLFTVKHIYKKNQIRVQHK